MVVFDSNDPYKEIMETLVDGIYAIPYAIIVIVLYFNYYTKMVLNYVDLDNFIDLVNGPMGNEVYVVVATIVGLFNVV